METLASHRSPTPILTLILILGTFGSFAASATTGPNFCSNTTQMSTRTNCHSCSISAFVSCPKGFTKRLGSTRKDCRYTIKTALTTGLSIGGCSQECIKDVSEPKCCPGYWGPECIECPEEANKPCNNNGACSDGMGGNGTCSCKPGFTGTACEDCADNIYGPTCSSACRCVHGLCSAGIHGDGTCTCFSGYKGPNCDQVLPECAALRCAENSRCMEEAHEGRMVCRCLPGYQENSEKKCISINPCEQPSACDPHATCAHLGPSRHSCTCSQGYSGDGAVCVAVNPCQTQQGGCSDDSARCVFDGPGRSHCECKDGFDHLVGGVRCSMTDVCKADSCGANARCSTLEPGVATCTCLAGFVRYGKDCHGNIMQRLTELNTEPGGQWTGQLGSAITLFGTLSWPLSNMGPFTVFVPINKGFKPGQARTLLADLDKSKYLCKLHIVAGVMTSSTLKQGDAYYTLTGKGGETITTDEDKVVKIRIYGSRKKADIVKSDVMASNGVIHLINKLMDSVSPTVRSEKEEDVMKILTDNGKFSQFKTLLQKANMAAMLEQPGPFTVFAPTGAAFDAMKDGHLEYLSSSEGSTKLLELLRNHVVSSSLEVYNAVSSPRIVSQANQVLSFNVSDNGQILVNGQAQVLEADVEAKNGRLYSLDAVLVPPSIQPLLPHRCDITENSIIKGTCVSCLRVTKSACPSGESLNIFAQGCVFRDLILGVNIPTRGCALFCNATVTTPKCCKGFYGPDCSPCPGGFTTPCASQGQCMDGIDGNGTCVCQANFKGSRCQYCSNPNMYGPACDKKCDCIHGDCDNRPDADGRCKPGSCQSRYTGKYCERHTQACGPQVHFCHAHAECDFNGGAVKCVCKPGYQGDGITCMEADPCALPLRGGCSENAKCVKTGPGTRVCQCLAGWREDGDECQAINACLDPGRGGCHANATCVYVGPGQSDCMCKSGFLGTGRECEAVNQCVTQNGGCHFLASCRYLSGQWTCVCDDGWTGDGKLCYGNMEQELKSISGIASFFRDVSDADISQTLIYQNVTVLAPSADAVAKMTQEDKDHWLTAGNLPSLVRYHMLPGIYTLGSLRNTTGTRLRNLLMAPLPVSITNESTAVGGATVTKANVMTINGLIHIIDKVLVPRREISKLLLEVLDRQQDLSLFRSYLVQHNLTERIEQEREYTVFAPTDSAIREYLKNTGQEALDANLTLYHVVPKKHLMRADLLSGTYANTMLGFSYQLEILPRDGGITVNGAQVNTTDIETYDGVIHSLTSVLEIRRNRCDVELSKISPGSCQDCFHPSKALCEDGGTPVTSIRRKCIFTRVYQSERLISTGCRFSCKTTTIVRKCCSGHFGQHCEPCPGPKDQACFGNGVCLDGVNGTGVCRCNKGFNGTACETCQSGRYGVHCDQDCSCRSGRCNDGMNGDGTCQCNVGWRGVACDEKITSKADELCNTVKCHTSANCVVNPDGYKCVCAAGFEGNGTYCTAKDACALNNGGCSPNAVCKRTLPGQRDCLCNKGYAGDGQVCVEINPCLEGNGGCHGNADCIHTGPNRTSCVCNYGYSGDGQTCSMISLCRKKNGDCHRYAKCNMTGPGVRTCTCMTNTIGDGLTCKGTVGKELLNRKLRDFYIGLMVLDINLRGRGPFTVFAPNAEAFLNGSQQLKPGEPLRGGFIREKFAHIFRYHIVSCHTLLASDLTTPRNLTTLMGDVLTVTSSEGSILINNKARVTFSDDASVNGVFHEIDTVLVPPSVSMKEEESESPIKFATNGKVLSNFSAAANYYGYKTFYKLLEDHDMLSLVTNPLHQPVMVFLPSDATMAALSSYQSAVLYHELNQRTVPDVLKYHIIHSTKVFAAELVHMQPARTAQGSELTFSCGGRDHIGEIFINGGKCRIIQRHIPFSEGMAYGIDCLLVPPSLGGRCDKQEVVEITLPCSRCTRSQCPDGTKEKASRPCDQPGDYVHKNTGCQVTCAVKTWSPQCCPGFYGRDCLECPGGDMPCNHHGKCDDGHLGNGTCACEDGYRGTDCNRCVDGWTSTRGGCVNCGCTEHGYCEQNGACFCADGWTGQYCETQIAVEPVCDPPCDPNAVCRDNGTCLCKPFYEGDGVNCTVADLCSSWNGGCAVGAKCSQKGVTVSCDCPRGHSGDGFSCQPIDPCVAEDNGGCHEHAICTMMGPGKKKCACKDNYIGDGVTCAVKELPMDRCLLENGDCHANAQCSDLHFQDITIGVFHVRSPTGQYKLNYTEAQKACGEEGADIATYNQLSYAQQAGLNLCAAGWLEQGRVSYPTTYANPRCGFGHVGIVDYGIRLNLSETWDAFCYRVKDVKCECKPGYVGDGYGCVGNLLQVLNDMPIFSNFLSQILNYSKTSESGRVFVKQLSNLTIHSTLFVPSNDGLLQNQTLTHRDLEYHLSEGQVLALKDLTNGSHIRTRLGHSLTVLGIADFLNPDALSSRYINDRFITTADVLAANGIIHILQGPLIAPPPLTKHHAAHKAGMGIGVLLLVLLVTGAVVMGYHFYTHKTKPFQFHYFKDYAEEEEEEATPPDCNPSICNPVYDSAPEAAEHASSELPEDKHQVVDSGPCDLLQDS